MPLCSTNSDRPFTIAPVIGPDEIGAGFSCVYEDHQSGELGIRLFTQWQELIVRTQCGRSWPDLPKERTGRRLRRQRATSHPSERRG